MPTEITVLPLSPYRENNAETSEPAAQNDDPKSFLKRTIEWAREMQAPILKHDTNAVEQDIAARRHEADFGYEFYRRFDSIANALKHSGSRQTIDQWCKAEVGCDISTMTRRRRLYNKWDEYERKRREIGACGQHGLLFALSLVPDVRSYSARKPQAKPLQIGSATIRGDLSPNSHAVFISGDALSELRQMSPGSVNVVVTSPAYYPSPRNYGDAQGIGFEATANDYVAKLVAVFNEARRVLSDDGSLWVILGDAYASKTSADRPAGNLLFIPERFAIAMQDAGWFCRSEIIWDKGPGGGKPEPVKDRPSRTHEKILMFSKQRRYFYDADPIREPLVTAHSTKGRTKAGVLRNDIDRTERVFNNPMGRNAGSVWTITPSSYRGDHPATFPVELADRILRAACPEDGTVLDCFGGAGTTALAAARLGLKAISIDINPAYTKEARERLAKESGDQQEKLAAD